MRDSLCTITTAKIHHASKNSIRSVGRVPNCWEFGLVLGKTPSDEDWAEGFKERIQLNMILKVIHTDHKTNRRDKPFDRLTNSLLITNTTRSRLWLQIPSRSGAFMVSKIESMDSVFKSVNK